MDKEQAARIIKDSYNGAKQIKGTGAELTPSEVQAITCLAFIPCEGSDPITAAFIAAFHAGFSRGLMMAGKGA